MHTSSRQLLAAREKRGSLVAYNFNVPPGLMHEIDRLITQGLFVNRSECFRYCLMRIIEEFKDF